MVESYLLRSHKYMQDHARNKTTPKIRPLMDQPRLCFSSEFRPSQKKDDFGLEHVWL